MSIKIDLGSVMFVPKGDWQPDVTYERNNLVRYNNAAWMCRVASSTGVEPSKGSTDWYVLAEDTSNVASVNGMTGEVKIEVVPTNHASDTTNYGVGSTSSYGHVKLTDTVASEYTASSGYAVSPTAVYQIQSFVENTVVPGMNEAIIKANDAYNLAADTDTVLAPIKNIVGELAEKTNSAIKDIQVDGTAVTITKNDGTVNTVYTQDTDYDFNVWNMPNNNVVAFITGTTVATSTAGTQVFDTGVYLTTVPGVLHVSRLEAGNGSIWIE
jgi:ribonuclease PH